MYISKRFFLIAKSFGCLYLIVLKSLFWSICEHGNMGYCGVNGNIGYYGPIRMSNGPKSHQVDRKGLFGAWSNWKMAQVKYVQKLNWRHGKTNSEIQISGSSRPGSFKRPFHWLSPWGTSLFGSFRNGSSWLVTSFRLLPDTPPLILQNPFCCKITNARVKNTFFILKQQEDPTFCFNMQGKECGDGVADWLWLREMIRVDDSRALLHSLCETRRTHVWGVIFFFLSATGWYVRCVVYCLQTVSCRILS